MNLTNKARSLRKNQTDVEQRSLFLEKRGFKVIRFWNSDVIENTVGVLDAIHMAILEITERAE
jgi:very-short-patch-repair endonuclease